MFLHIHFGFYSIFNLHSRFILYPIKSICNPIFQSSNNHIPQIKSPRRLMHPREIKINSIHPTLLPIFPIRRIPIRSRTLSTSTRPIFTFTPSHNYPGLLIHSLAPSTHSTAQLCSRHSGNPSNFTEQKGSKQLSHCSWKCIDRMFGPCIEFTDREIHDIYTIRIFTELQKIFSRLLNLLNVSV